MEQKCKCGLSATRRFSIETDNGFFHCCDNKQCKESLENELYEYETHYRNQYFQGKSLISYKFSSGVLFFSVIVVTTLSLCYFIWNIVNNFIR
jgi:hypothetical protein